MKNISKLKLKTQNLSILYIENDLTLQNKLSQYFKEIFKSTYQAFSTEEGLKLYKKFQPNIVLTDLQSSKLDPFDMILKIKEINKDVNIIVLSNINDTYNLLKSFDVGLIDLLTKPLKIEQLNNAFEKVVKKAPQVILKSKDLKKDVPKKEELKPKISTKIDNAKEYVSKKENNEPQVISQHKNITLDELKLNNKEVTCINNYRGLIIHSKEKVLSYTNDRLLIKVDKTQLVAIIHEKKLVIQVDTHLILLKLLKIKREQNIAIFDNPTLLDHTHRDLTNKRLHLDDSFRASISYKSKHLEVKALDISSEYLSIKTKEKIEFQINTHMELTLGFELNGPSVLVSDKKFTKVFAKAIIQRIENEEHFQKVVLKISIAKADENTFKKYLKQRELEIINEFKMRMKI